ncbi:MAG: Ig-like domain-containing protein [Bryobacteraceae bacterium]|jgi:hypothetical protein
MATVPGRVAWLARISFLPLALQIAASLLPAQTLQITSPVDGAVVRPGQAVAVSVSASGASFQRMVVIGWNPIGLSQILAAPPWQFLVQIPSDISLRRYALTANGVITPGNTVYSAPISIDVERSDTPESVKVQPSTLLGLSVGDTGCLIVQATYADGTTPDISQATQIVYASDTSAVATVNNIGMVTAVAPGSAKITITYGGISVRVPVTVPQPMAVVPTAVMLNPSQREQFYAQLAMPDGTDPTVTWSIHPALGTIDGTGLYTAPSSVDSKTRVVVTATLVTDPTKSASAQVTLVPSKDRPRNEPSRLP